LAQVSAVGAVAVRNRTLAERDNGGEWNVARTPNE
jgi:hypothetical protein